MSSATNWEQLWKQYSESLENWRKVFDEVLKASSEMQKNFNAVMEKAGQESSADTMKQFGENWQKAMTDAGIQSVKEFNEYWQNAMKQPDNGFKQFAENWQKSMSGSGLDQMKAYGDMMKKFSETWNAMWPQKIDTVARCLKPLLTRVSLSSFSFRQTPFLCSHQMYHRRIAGNPACLWHLPRIL